MKTEFDQLSTVDVKMVIIDDPTFLTFRRLFHQRYSQAVSLNSGLPTKITDQTDLSVKVDLPIKKIGKNFIDEAIEKEPEERLILEALTEERKKEQNKGAEDGDGFKIECEYCE